VDPGRRARRALILIAPTLAVGLIAAVVAVASRGGDPAFEFDQRHPRTISPLELETLVRKAPEPTPEGPGPPARSVKCVAHGRTGQRNPWDCDADYPTGHRIVYRIHVRVDGSYSGVDPTGQFVVRGCCVAGGTAAAG
jgi:hypothetical protein